MKFFFLFGDTTFCSSRFFLLGLTRLTSLSFPFPWVSTGKLSRSSFFIDCLICLLGILRGSKASSLSSSCYFSDGCLDYMPDNLDDFSFSNSSFKSYFSFSDSWLNLATTSASTFGFFLSVEEGDRMRELGSFWRIFRYSFLFIIQVKVWTQRFLSSWDGAYRLNCRLVVLSWN